MTRLITAHVINRSHKRIEMIAHAQRLWRPYIIVFSHVSVNLSKCFREFSNYVINVSEINTCKSVTGHWGSYGDHIRAVEQQPTAPLLCQLDRASWVHSPHRQVTNEVHHVTVHSVPSVWAPTITVIILRSDQAETCSAVTKKLVRLVSCRLSPATRWHHFNPPIGQRIRPIHPIRDPGAKLHMTSKPVISV